jgi:hypothetical protein
LALSLFVFLGACRHFPRNGSFSERRILLQVVVGASLTLRDGKSAAGNGRSTSRADLSARHKPPLVSAAGRNDVTAALRDEVASPLRDQVAAALSDKATARANSAHWLVT